MLIFMKNVHKLVEQFAKTKWVFTWGQPELRLAWTQTGLTLVRILFFLYIVYMSLAWDSVRAIIKPDSQGQPHVNKS